MRRAVALGAAVLVMAGCAPQVDREGTRPSAAPGLPAVSGVTAEAVRLRTDAAVGNRFHLRITASEAFAVTAVALRVPGFDPVPAVPVTAEFEAGRVIDLPVTYDGVDCAVRPGPAAALLTVRRPDGAVEELAVPLAGDVPARLHAEACAAERLAESVEVVVTALQPGDEELTGRLTLRRRDSAEPVTVGRLGRSVLLDVDAELPLELPADALDAAAAVVFQPATCEPHVLAETKQPHVFPLEITVGEESPVVVDLPVDDALRTALVDLVRRVCDPA
ncbi:hypothetical protein [Blastococcus sp. LR1]|uniref:hypothetical protein n=1 Tax=Blastococcus sp. LR1 TaxID=2877000 RepID=UPI001CCC07FE|nr:hypothetical protein [Blastococcus sp. LR1]MCA0145879.1 hypothetical protein [Blastococcus sp. LR1]